MDLWINGQPAGESTGGPAVLWDKPIAIDITEQLKPEPRNRFTVRVHDQAYAGGLWKPVWIAATD